MGLNRRRLLFCTLVLCASLLGAQESVPGDLEDTTGSYSGERITRLHRELYRISWQEYEGAVRYVTSFEKQTPGQSAWTPVDYVSISREAWADISLETGF